MQMNPVSALIKEGKPCAIGKIGGTEAKALLFAKQGITFLVRPNKFRRIRNDLYIHSGVYPSSPEVFGRFWKFWESKVFPEVDLLVHWQGENDLKLARKYAFTNDWMTDKEIGVISGWFTELAGKKVTVISPFVNTIRQQWSVREKIWKNLGMTLPDFELRLIASPHYAHLVPPEHQDWFAALSAMESELSSQPYDILIVGAGAWGLPLAVAAKRSNRIGIHLGGELQLLFGIKGARWCRNGDPSYMNSHWVYPIPADIPPAHEQSSLKFKDDCAYWENANNPPSDSF